MSRYVSRRRPTGQRRSPIVSAKAVTLDRIGIDDRHVDVTVQHCLNEYHLQFLQLMVRGNVRFLVIGGQARRIYFGSTTRDLDLWVDISPLSISTFRVALSNWKAKYPVHTIADLSRLPLRAGLQIKIPDADCIFLDAMAILLNFERQMAWIS
jgi:hypothetical protein